MAVALAVVVIVHGQFAVSQLVTLPMGCAIWPVMFGSGFRTGGTIVTMVPQLMVQLGNHLQALTGLIAAVPGTATPGSCGQLFATAAFRAAATATSGSASHGRCARPLALGPLGPWPCAPVAGRQRSVGANGQQGAPGVARLLDGTL
jgi:hypothetical protein